MSSNVRRRVKVYQLDGENQWADKGTGYVECKHHEPMKSYFIVVVSEDDAAVTLMNSKVLTSTGDHGYQRQQDTLIVWTEPSGVDVALSFQEAQGCQELWDQLQTIQEKIASEADREASFNQNQFNLYQMETAARSLNRQGETVGLSEPSLANLKEVLEVMQNASKNPFGRDKLAEYIMSKNYIEKLVPIFERAEDLESLDDLHILYEIMKLIVTLNDNSVFEHIVQDNLILPVCGMLEYDPLVPGSRGQFRNYLTQNVNYKKVITINDPTIEAKIHQIFRLMFIKDVVGARWIDDIAHSILVALMHFHEVDIISYLQSHMEFVEEILSILNSPQTPVSQKRDVLTFVKELVTISKQVNNHQAFFRSLGHHGFFNMFHSNLSSEDLVCRQLTSEILGTIVEYDPALVRSFNLAQFREGLRPLIDLLTERLLVDPDLGLKTQITEIFKSLMDTGLSLENKIADINSFISGAVKLDNDAEEFLQVYYDNSIQKLVQPILQLPDYSPKVPITVNSSVDELVLPRELSESIYHICDLLTMMVKNHHYRIKNFLMRAPVSRKMVSLLRAKEKHIQLAALRYFRTQIGQKDEFYNRYIITHNVFEPIVRILLNINKRYNLMNSAILELFEFIRKNNMKNLISYTVEKFGTLVENITYVDTFKDLKLRYEQNMEKPDEGGSEATRVEDGFNIGRMGMAQRGCG
ncbi:component of IIS longevity pathway SMK-1-domain-containing protein [Paraphysoderma sedebokerense]|nr:component of IIS longevity pathway SMK-1-domain-containing protein [Paraphysoderma sedebokerense]